LPGREQTAFADTPVPSATHRDRICTEVKAMIRYQRGVFGRKAS